MNDRRFKVTRQAVLVSGWLAFVYFLLMLVLMTAEEWLLFPRGGKYLDDASFSHEEIWLSTEDGLRLHAWYCPAGNSNESMPRPVVLFFHGNAGELSSRAELAMRWQQFLGADVLLFDYRGFGKSQGIPSEPGLYLDARAAYRYLTLERKCPPKQVIFVGRSLGAAVALELAIEIPPRALILEGAFVSAPAVAQNIYPWLPVTNLMRNRFPSIDRVSQYPGAVFFSHGEIDTLIPPDHMNQLYERAPGRKRRMLLSGAGHNTLPPVDYYREVKAFIDET